MTGADDKQYELAKTALKQGQKNLARKYLENCPDNQAAQKELAELDTIDESLGVSICIITKNNEKTLARCLVSLAALNAEIVIVDTGSTDKTLKIATKYTRNIYHFKWVDDFAAARNYAAKLAKYNYIMTIDSDEYLLQPKQDELKKFFDGVNSRKKVGCYLQVNMLGKSKEQRPYIASVSRVYDKRYYKFLFPIHEQLTQIYKDKVDNDPVYDLKLQCIHYGYTNQSKLVKKNQRNQALLVKQLKNDPTNTYYMFQLAKTYSILKKYKEAFRIYQEFFRFQKEYIYLWTRDAIDSYIKLCFITKKYDKALDCVQKCKQDCMESLDMLCLFANVYVASDQDEKAIEVLKIAEKLPVTAAYQEFGYRKQDVYQQLAEIYARKGKWLLMQQYEKLLPQTGQIKNEWWSVTKNKKLSIVVFVRNNETVKLEECLVSLALFKAEYVVIILGSSLASSKIAHQFTEQVYMVKEKLEADLYNFALAKAKGNYVFWINADEKLQGADFSALDKFLAKVGNYVGNIVVEEPFLTKSDEPVLQSQTRFGYRKFIKFDGKYIASPITRKKGQNIQQIELPITLKHNLTKEEYQKYNEIRRTKLKNKLKNSIDVTLLAELATNYFSNGDNVHAIKYYYQLLTLPLDLQDELTLNSVTNLINALVNEKQYQDALKIVGIFKGYYAELSDFLFAAGTAYMNMAQFEQALNAFEQAQRQANSRSLGINSYLSSYNQGVIFEVQGKKKEAIGKYHLSNGYRPAKEGLIRLLN